MASTPKHSHGADEVYEAVDAVLATGVLVIPSTTATTNPGLQGVKVATDAALNVLGVSASSAVPVANQTTTGNDSDGYPYVAPDMVNELVTVYSACVINVTYTAVAVAYGAKLCAAANGAVRAWVSGTDSPAAIVGTCRVPGGMSSAGGTGLAKINLS